jgi:hypothetical protein
MPIPYGVTCSECGWEVHVAARKSDDDCDVFIKVAPCKRCLEQAVEEAVEDERVASAEEREGSTES